MRQLFAAMHQSAHGTFETCSDVRSSGAIRGEADIEKAVLNDRVSSSGRLAISLSAGLLPTA